NATFSVGGAGCAPLTYQWSHNGIAIPGASSSVLTLNGVHLGDAGDYKVALANIAGSTLSASATLTVQEVATPTCTPVGGSYPSAQNVAVACATPSAIIRYTTSGLDPTDSDPSVASGSTVLVDHNLTLKAKASKTGSASSAV